MKFNQKVHRLRIWSPHTKGIHQKFFLRDDVSFGSDKKANIRIQDLEGFHARLDFSTQEIHFLESDIWQKVEAGALFEIGGHIFQWQPIEFKKSGWQPVALCLIGGLMLIGIVQWFAPEPQLPRCNSRTQRIAAGQWSGAREDREMEQLNNFRKSFQAALKEKLWAKARVELDSIQEILLAQRAESCGMMEPLESLETQFSRALVSTYIKEGSLEAAAEAIQRHKARFSKDQPIRFETQLLRVARKIYFEGYRLEEEDAVKGQELMERAQNLCAILERPSDCFKTEFLQDALRK